MSSRIVFDQPTVEWMARAAVLSAQLGLGAETDAVESGDIAAQRAARLRLSNVLFAEFGEVDARPVSMRDHEVAVNGAVIRVRQYRRADAVGTLPGYLLLHGGGFWLGTIDEEINRALCSYRALEADVTLFDVDYRLAPEHPYPTALDDALAALTWIHENAAALEVDPERMIVGGVSAGGNLAAALTRLARDRGGPPIAGQLLEVPAVDLRSTVEWSRDYADANNIGVIGDLTDVYAPGASPDDPYLSPAVGGLVGLPPTHVMTAEYDPLASAAETYVADLRAAGVEVSATRHLGLLHGSAGLIGRSRGARLWHAEVVSVLRELTARG